MQCKRGTWRSPFLELFSTALLFADDDDLFDSQTAAEGTDRNRAMIGTIDGGQTDNVRGKRDDQIVHEIVKIKTGMNQFSLSFLHIFCFQQFRFFTSFKFGEGIGTTLLPVCPRLFRVQEVVRSNRSGLTN